MPWVFLYFLTSAYFPAGSMFSSSGRMLPVACSAASMVKPSLFSISTASSVDSIYSHSTESVAPKALFWISRFGGVAVMPQRYILSTLKASAVRNTEPVLCWLRILSSKMTRGILGACLNSSIEMRSRSIIESFCMCVVFRCKSKLFLKFMTFLPEGLKQTPIFVFLNRMNFGKTISR